MIKVTGGRGPVGPFKIYNELLKTQGFPDKRKVKKVVFLPNGKAAIAS